MHKKLVGLRRTGLDNKCCYSSSLPTEGARAGLLEDATGLRVEDASFSAASAASIHSE